VIASETSPAAIGERFSLRDSHCPMPSANGAAPRRRGIAARPDPPDLPAL